MKKEPNLRQNAKSLMREFLLAEKAEMAKSYFWHFEEDYTKYIAGLTQQYQKPTLGVSLLSDSLSKTLYPFEEYNYKAVYFPSPERAVKALCGMVQYRNWLKRQNINKGVTTQP